MPPPNAAAPRAAALRARARRRLAALAAPTTSYARVRGVRRPARRRQDDDDRQDCGAGARAPRPAARPGRRRRRSASAPSSSCACYADIIGAPFRVARTPPSSTQALDGRRAQPRARRHGRPVAVRRGVARSVRRARRAPRRPHAPRDGRRHAVGVGAPHLRRATRDAQAVAPRADQARRSRVAVAARRRCCASGSCPSRICGTGQRVPEDLQRATPAQLWPPRVLGEPAPEARDACHDTRSDRRARAATHHRRHQRQGRRRQDQRRRSTWPSSLARLGHRVGILDADFGLGNVDVMLGLTPDAAPRALC